MSEGKASAAAVASAATTDRAEPEAQAEAQAEAQPDAAPASGVGFLLTRHWRDTAAGTEVELWLATDHGPRRLRLPPHESVAFLPADQQAQAEIVIGKEAGCALRPLSLLDFSHRPVLGL